MRTDAIDLEIFGTRLRVICEDQRGVGVLRSALAEHLIGEPAPLGFALRAPKGRDHLYVLLDRSGFVLGRSRSADECLAVLAGQLGVFVPAPIGTTRLRMRALVGENSEAVLAPFPILASPPMVERRLDRAKHRMIDRLAIDVTSDGRLQMSHSPWPALANLHLPPGHMRATNDHPITAVLAQTMSEAPPSRAGLSWLLAASATSDSTPDFVLTLAERLSGIAGLSVDLNRPSTVYEVLSRC